MTKEFVLLFENKAPLHSEKHFFKPCRSSVAHSNWTIHRTPYGLRETFFFEAFCNKFFSLNDLLRRLKWKTVWATMEAVTTRSIFFRSDGGNNWIRPSRNKNALCAAAVACAKRVIAFIFALPSRLPANWALTRSDGCLEKHKCTRSVKRWLRKIAVWRFSIIEGWHFPLNESRKKLFALVFHTKRERLDKDSGETTQEEGVQTFDQQLTAITFAILEAVIILL